MEPVQSGVPALVSLFDSPLTGALDNLSGAPLLWHPFVTPLLYLSRSYFLASSLPRFLVRR